MLVERSEITVKDGTESKFQAVLAEQVVPLLHRVAGVISVQVGKGVENPTKFMLIVGWTSLAMHKTYGGTPTSLEVRQIMGPFIASGAMEHFEIA